MPFTDAARRKAWEVRERNAKLRAEGRRVVRSKADRHVKPHDLDGQFRIIQRRALRALKDKTTEEQLKKMDVDEISKVLKACRENLHAIRVHKAMEREDRGQIEFVTSVPLEKESK